MTVRDVLGYSAGEAVAILTVTEDSMTSAALKRARAAVRSGRVEPSAAPDSPEGGLEPGVSRVSGAVSAGWCPKQALTRVRRHLAWVVPVHGALFREVRDLVIYGAAGRQRCGDLSQVRREYRCSLLEIDGLMPGRFATRPTWRGYRKQKRAGP